MPHSDLLPASQYDDTLLEVIQSAPLPGLDAQPICRDTADRVGKVIATGGLSGTLRAAGLWLLAGELDQSHSISQSHDSAVGSLWHGIMHRREGDLSNAKYWFRRSCAGGTSHGLHRQLAEVISEHQSTLPESMQVDDLTSADRVANSLVDHCGAALTRHPDWRQHLEQICWWEWQLLFALSD